MHNNMSLNRIIEAFDHSLIVKKVAREDAGIYYCHSDLEEDDENIFRYVIDGTKWNPEMTQSGVFFRQLPLCLI